MIAEIMIWGAATVQVLGVYYYQQKDKDMKSQKMEDKFNHIQDTFDSINNRLDIIDQQISFIQDYLAVHSKDDGIDENEIVNLMKDGS